MEVAYNSNSFFSLTLRIIINFVCFLANLDTSSFYLILFLYNLGAFSKTPTLLRLISSLRVTDNMNTFYNLFKNNFNVLLLANSIRDIL